MVLKGADCVAAFHLVDVSGQPLDPATVPAGGRLPQGGGIASGAVPASAASGSGTGTGGTTSGGGPPAAQTVSPPPGVDDFFSQFGGSPTLADAIGALIITCKTIIDPKVKKQCLKDV